MPIRRQIKHNSIQILPRQGETIRELQIKNIVTNVNDVNDKDVTICHYLCLSPFVYTYFVVLQIRNVCRMLVSMVVRSSFAPVSSYPSLHRTGFKSD